LHSDGGMPATQPRHPAPIYYEVIPDPHLVPPPRRRLAAFASREDAFDWGLARYGDASFWLASDTLEAPGTVALA